MEVKATAPRCQLLLIVLMAAMLLLGMKVSLLLVQRKITRTIVLQESIDKGGGFFYGAHTSLNSAQYCHRSWDSFSRVVLGSKTVFIVIKPNILLNEAGNCSFNFCEKLCWNFVGDFIESSYYKIFYIFEAIVKENCFNGMEECTTGKSEKIKILIYKFETKPDQF
ncbi:hypothetical protein STEG23_000227 [Scotinomys teguina]